MNSIATQAIFYTHNNLQTVNIGPNPLNIIFSLNLLYAHAMHSDLVARKYPIIQSY